MTRFTPTEVPIAWEVTGSGSPLLLIMGLGYARWAWDPLVHALAEAHSVITFDNRGIGESGNPRGPYTASMMASDARAVLDDAGFSDAAVIGLSLGGMIAQELAIETPERVSHLVLMATTPGGPSSFPMPEATVDLMQSAPHLDPDDALRSFVANALSPAADPSLVELLFEARRTSPQSHEGWVAQAAAGLGYDGANRAGSITAPTLIITGTADNVVDPRNSSMLLEAISDARLITLDGGHLIHWEQPEACSDAILEHIESGPA